MNKLNKLIGIPFKLGGTDFNGCDCRGICYLYHKHVHGIDYPNTDGGKVIFRDRKKDIERIDGFLLKFCHHIGFDDLQEGDFAIFKGIGSAGSLAVCIDRRRILYMNKINGSSIIKKEALNRSFVSGYRPFKYEKNN